MKTLLLTAAIVLGVVSTANAGDIRNFCNYYYKSIGKTKCVNLQQEAQRWLENSSRNDDIVDFCKSQNVLQKGITSYTDYYTSKKCYLDEQKRREANDALKESGGQTTIIR